MIANVWKCKHNIVALYVVHARSAASRAANAVIWCSIDSICTSTAGIGEPDSLPGSSRSRGGARRYSVCRWSRIIPGDSKYAHVLFARSSEWRERQQEEIAKRDEESKARRQETISKAERALDNFYEEYTASRKAQIAQNKYV